MNLNWKIDKFFLFKTHFSELKFCEENPKTCLNDGKCTSITKDEGLFKCECPSGFKGKKCEMVPMIANLSMTISTPKPSKTTKLPSQETTISAENDAEFDNLHTTEAGSNEGDVVEETSVEDIDNEA